MFPRVKWRCASNMNNANCVKCRGISPLSLNRNNQEAHKNIRQYHLLGCLRMSNVGRFMLIHLLSANVRRFRHKSFELLRIPLTYMPNYVGFTLSMFHEKFPFLSIRCFREL